MNPILVKELRQSLRSRWFEIIFLWLCVSLTLITAIGSAVGSLQVTTIVFWTSVAFTLHILLPFRTALSARDDRQRGNFELIRVSGLGAEKLANQRLTALLFHTLVLASIVLPFVLLRYFLGGIDLIDELQYLALLVLGTPVVGAVFLWISVVGTFGRVALGALFSFLFMVFESLTATSAFATGTDVVIPLTLLLFGSLICLPVSLAFATEAFLLHTP
jgi:hypothetical protein